MHIPEAARPIGDDYKSSIWHIIHAHQVGATSIIKHFNLSHIRAAKTLFKMENSRSVCHSEGKGKECSNSETSVLRLLLKIVLCTYSFFSPHPCTCYYSVIMLPFTQTQMFWWFFLVQTQQFKDVPHPLQILQLGLFLLTHLSISFLILQLPQLPCLYPLLTFPFFPLFPFISVSLFSSHFLYRAISTKAGALGVSNRPVSVFLALQPEWLKTHV